MRLESIHLYRVGPLNDRTIYFLDQWRQKIHELTLLSGPNGCGKSTALRAVSHLWQMTGHWLALPGRFPGERKPSALWLSRWGASAMILSDVPGVAGKVGVFFGDPAVLKNLSPQCEFWIGETKDVRDGRGPRRRVLIHKGQSWFMDWGVGFKRLGLNPNEQTVPNVVHLDGEERRWVPPRIGLGEVVADDPGRRWLVNYWPSADWRGQIEASLIAMKTVAPERFLIVLEELNAFLEPKRILPDPDQNMRLLVRTPAGSIHSLDDLSAGEHQILIQLFLVSRSLMPGGIVMIDEPDLHLHPSLLTLYLTRLEILIQSRGGQLIVTSHNPDLWSRYEARGHRIEMGGAS